MTDPKRRAAVIGTGLIGGSVGLALRRAGWHVTGDDLDHARARRALELGALDAVGTDPAAAITFVATPVGVTADAVRVALDRGPGVVTDVGSVKAPVMAAVDDPRFVGGHPMAGSEQVGVDGADADLFVDAVWVLTPDERTSDEAILAVRSTVAELGAEVMSLAPEHHDDLVALVSHVPHLAAATLMQLAGDHAEDHGILLRLAAGGFRDMTRIASGDPGIWPDICIGNSGAIVAALDGLIGRLGEVREAVASHDRDGLLDQLEEARRARRNLPVSVHTVGDVSVLRVPVPDRPGILAEVTTLATELSANIFDIEIAHSGEGDRGVLILVVASDRVQALAEALAGRGMRPSVQGLD